MRITLRGNLTTFSCIVAATCQFFVGIETLRADCASAPSALIAWWRAETACSIKADTNRGTLFNGTNFVPARSRFYRLRKP